jgi:hypothetical protein
MRQLGLALITFLGSGISYAADQVTYARLGHPLEVLALLYQQGLPTRTIKLRVESKDLNRAKTVKIALVGSVEELNAKRFVTAIIQAKEDFWLATPKFTVRVVGNERYVVIQVAESCG